jgi:hypothetical protein
MTDFPFDDELDDLDFWRLCDEMSVFEAALLVAGKSPGQMPYVEQWDPDKRPRGYEAAKTAIANALRGGRIKGTVVPEFTRDFNCDPEPIQGTVSVSSRVEVASLKEFLADRGFRRGFFFPDRTETPDYLDPGNSRFAPKLAAAVRAWQAVTAPVGKHPKQALSKWLRENGAEFGLTDEDGKPNETGIDEVAKVANWQPSGGAPRTPTSEA